MKTINAKLRPLALACGFVALMGSVGAQAASIPGLRSTGFDSFGNLLGADTQDPNYSVKKTGGEGAPFDFGNGWVTKNSGFPMQYWAANTNASKWLTPTDNQGDSFDSTSIGFYKWVTTFDLTGYLPTTASFTFKWGADNTGKAYLNGNLTSNLGGGNHYAALSAPITVNSGFVSGLNTLEFLVENYIGGGNPTGLRVELTNSSVSPVPLPPAALLFGSVLLGAGVFGRKKLFNKSVFQEAAA